MLKKSGMVFLSFFLNGVVALLSINILARVLPARDYGLYGVIVSSATVLNAIFFQWIRIFILQMKLKDLECAENFKNVLKNLLSISILSLIIFVAIFRLVCGFFGIIFEGGGNQFYVLFLIGFCGVVQGLFEIDLAKSRAGNNFLKFFIQNSIKSISWVLCLALIFLFSLNYAAVALLFSLSYFAVLLYSWRENFSFLFELKVGVLTIKKMFFDFDSKMLLPIFGVVLNVSTPFLYKVLSSNANSDDLFASLVATYDLSILICATLPLAANYIYQGDLVRYFNEKDERIKFSKSFNIAIASILVSLLISWVIVKFLSSYFVGNKLLFLSYANQKLIIGGSVLLALKSNWLDHAFYLQKNYVNFSLTSGVMLIGLFFINFFTPYFFQFNVDFSSWLAISYFCGALFSVLSCFIFDRKFLLEKMFGVRVLSFVFFIFLFVVNSKY